MSGLSDYDSTALVITANSQRLTDINAMIPQTWWFTSNGIVTENVVCLREQILAEVLLNCGLL